LNKRNWLKLGLLIAVLVLSIIPFSTVMKHVTIKGALTL